MISYSEAAKEIMPESHNKSQFIYVKKSFVFIVKAIFRDSWSIYLLHSPVIRSSISSQRWSCRKQVEMPCVCGEQRKTFARERG